MSEEKKSNIVLTIALEEDKFSVFSNLPKLVQIGLLLDAANQLFSKLVLSLTDEEVKSFDNKKVQ
jgi:hypothetical protein